MSNIQNRKEIQAKIAKLKKQVKRAEEKGNFNSAHHIMLERYQAMLKPKPVERVPLRNADDGDMEG